MLVGRATELAEIARTLDVVQSGAPWFVQIVGEPGIGKTRLLAELGQRAEARGWLVLEGRAAEFERDIPFGLIVDAINDYLGGLEPAFLRSLDDDVVAELASIFPSIASRGGQLAAERAGVERYRVHYAIRTLLERLAAQRALVLALDDVHWADAATIEVIGHLARRFRGPLLVAITMRRAPGRLEGSLAAAQRAGVGSRLGLTPLSSDDAGALLGPDVDAAARETLYRESGGNPFYLEQLARSSRSRAPSAPVLTDPRAVGWSPPAVVVAAIRDELTELSAEARGVLNAAAVAGESFESELLAAIVARPQPLVLPALDELVITDLIRTTEVPTRFRFRHPIVRTVVYDAMPRGWRLGAHARAARALAAGGAPARLYAHHVEISAKPGDQQAIALLVDAAQTAAPRTPLTAGHWLLAALRLLPARADPDQRLQLLTEAASALASGGAHDESLAATEQALDLLPWSRAEARAELIVRLANVERLSGRPPRARELLEQARRSISDVTSRAFVAVGLQLAIDYYWRGEFAMMRELAQQLLPTARATSDALMISLAGALSTVASAALGQIQHAATALDEARAAFELLRDEQLAERIDVSAFLAMASVRLERVDEALAQARRGLRVARETSQGAMIPGLLALEANTLVLAGHVSEAARVAETATDAALLAGNEWLTVWALASASCAAFWAGDTERTLAAAQETVSRSSRIGETYFTGLARLQLAGALYANGDPVGALAELASFDAPSTRPLLDASGGYGWDLLIRLHLALGDVDAAGDTASHMEARAAGSELTNRRAATCCARAAVCLARGEPRAAESSAREATEIAEQSRSPLLVGRARMLLGGALDAVGERDAACEQLKRAESGLAECGALREADAAARELRRLGHRVAGRTRRATQRSGLAELSSRERQVADLVASGMTNREVAQALFLSEKTVGSHLARIYDKLGVHSRTVLAAMVARADDLPVGRGVG